MAEYYWAFPKLNMKIGKRLFYLFIFLYCLNYDVELLKPDIRRIGSGLTLPRRPAPRRPVASARAWAPPSAASQTCRPTTQFVSDVYA